MAKFHFSIIAKLTFLLIVIIFIIPCSNRAQPIKSLSFSVAKFGVLDHSDNSAKWRLEYRVNNREWIFNPLAGIMSNVNGALYFYSGVMYDIFLTHNFVITPSFAPGIWSQGHSKDLNFIFQLRSQIEFAYISKNNERIGFSFNHISNAGFGDSNPGVESFAMTYSLPVSLLIESIFPKNNSGIVLLPVP